MKSGFLEKMAFYIVCVVIATVSLYFAAVQAWVWPFYAAAMMLAYIGDARGTYINRNHFAGFIEMVFPLCLGYVLSFGDWTGRKEKKRFFLGAGALSGLVSIGFHSFFDFNLEMPANAVYFVLLMAIVCVCTEPDNLSQSSQSTQSH